MARNPNIFDSLETTNNPFENESTFLSTESRKEQRRKGKKPRSKRFKTDENEDPEIEAEIKDSLETVNNPFEGNETVFVSTENRVTQRRKRKRMVRYRIGVHRKTSKRFRDGENEILGE